MKIYNVFTAIIDFPKANGFDELLNDAASGIISQMKERIKENNLIIPDEDNLGAYMLAENDDGFQTDKHNILFAGTYKDAEDFFSQTEISDKDFTLTSKVYCKEDDVCNFFPYIVIIDMFGEIDCYLFGALAEDGFLGDMVNRLYKDANAYRNIAKDYSNQYK